jgi:hypothetical protein
VQQVDDFVRRQKLGPFTVVTVGPKPLEINAEMNHHNNGLAEKRAVNAS